MMDVCILGVSRKIIECPATYGSICLGALFGSFLTCVILILPIPYESVKFVIFHGLISVLMTKIGLRIKWNRKFLRAYAIVYISAVFVGGIFSSLKQYMREAGLFFGFATVSYCIALGIWKLILHMAKCRNYHCDVLLCQGENQVKVKALIDTGNCLRDSVTGKAVNIISKHTARRLWQDISTENLRYIPYHTIGKREGVLPLLSLERMCLYLDDEKWISQALVAVSEELGSADEYEMILNPDVK